MENIVIDFTPHELAILILEVQIKCKDQDQLVKLARSKGINSKDHAILRKEYATLLAALEYRKTFSEKELLLLKSVISQKIQRYANQNLEGLKFGYLYSGYESIYNKIPVNF